VKRPPYRLCWWCNRQFQGNHWRELVTASQSFFVHVSCVQVATNALSHTPVTEVKTP
jgi:hypothetical protein